MRGEASAPHCSCVCNTGEKRQFLNQPYGTSCGGVVSFSGQNSAEPLSCGLAVAKWVTCRPSKNGVDAMAQGKQKLPRVRRFSVGDKVRVKRGVFACKYADIPLGGWAGTIIEVQYSPKSRYLIEWNPKTLESIHPIYERRCERDGRKHTEMWLAHADVVRDKGGRLSIVAPKTIISAPLSKHNQEDRIRAVFGLTSDDLLPSAIDPRSGSTSNT